MVEIHDGPYNNIKNWDYAGLILAFNAEDGRGRGLRATSGRELEEAIKVAVARKGLSRDHHREMTVMDAVKNVLGLDK